MKELELLKEIINDFSLEKFQDFFSYKNYDFKPYFDDVSFFINDSNRFEGAKKIGEIISDELELVFLGIKTKGNITERSSKKAQYDFAKKILKNIDSGRFQAGIFIFYDDQGNFRFSLVYQVPKGKRREWSVFKRHTYYVAKDKPYRTFLKALVEAKFDDLDSIIKAFSIAPLTKEFYTEIQDWYAWALKESWFPGGRLEENLIRLITRLIFVWFLKEKGLIPEDIFEKEFLKNVVKDFGKKDYYYNAILQNLFFATLNRKPENRRFATDGNFFENRQDYNVNNVYRYKEKLLIPEKQFIEIFRKTPFINGGLFECLDDKDRKILIDGFSRKDKQRAKLPDYLFFSQEKKEDLSHFYGTRKQKKVRGLINILKDYSFTADESSPIDVEVSLDPELLGHIFENLLAAYNPETQTTARKSTGSYYTPKEIVEFMVDESLFYYFKTKTGIEDDKLRRLLSYDDEVLDFDEEEINSIVKAIDELKIIDPAVGSGAFPMGILQKLVYILGKIDPENELWKERQYKRALKEIEKILKIENKEEREKQLKEVNENFDANINYPDYARKLYLIENSIYGVDIQPIAIQICKLRFFLSLLIDQKKEVKPLPHLETKFVSANTLIALRKGGEVEQLNWVKKGDHILLPLKEELKKLYKKHFSIKNRQEKLRLKKKAEKTREKLKELLVKNNWNAEEAEKLAKFDIFDQTATANWFDPEWMFGVDDGFDIVIGNPPYIQLQKNRGELANLYKNEGYETYDRMGDIYCLFYERGIKLLKEKGILCYISSNKWMRAGYGEKLRKFFSKYNPLLVIDLGPGVFENATVDTCIVIIQKAPNQDQLRGFKLTKKGELQEDKNLIKLPNFGKDIWFIGTPEEIRLKEKIEKIGVPLKDWEGINIYYGIKTGLNEAFIINEDTRKQILSNCKTEEERKRTSQIIKPVLRGKDIKRYCYEWKGTYIIVIPAGWTNKNKGNQKAEDFIYSQFPSLMSYLDNFKNEAIKRYDKGDYWWELRHCDYYEEFEKEKIIWQEIVQEPQFHYDTEGFYVEATGFIMTGKHLKYICALLNSKFVSYIFKKFYAGGGLGDKGYRYKKAFLEDLPIPIVTRKNNLLVQQIEDLVEKIITFKINKSTLKEIETEINRLVYEVYQLTKDVYV